MDAKSPATDAFWRAYCAASGTDPATPYVVDRFGDPSSLNPELDPDIVGAGGVFSRDMPLVRRDGSRLWCSVHAKGIQADRPELGGVCVMQDISARKQAEAALVAANERLERGLAEVERTRAEISQLAELSSFLQACATAAEAHAAIADCAPRLFPGSAGALYRQEDGGIELMNEALRWSWLGFLVMFVTGVLLFMSHAGRAYENPFFRTKLIFLAMLGINAAVYQVVFYPKMPQWLAGRTPSGAKACAILSLILWIGVIVCGRTMAYQF